jgi:hypothetical protein
MDGNLDESKPATPDSQDQRRGPGKLQMIAADVLSVEFVQVPTAARRGTSLADCVFQNSGPTESGCSAPVAL